MAQLQSLSLWRIIAVERFAQADRERKNRSIPGALLLHRGVGELLIGTTAAGFEKGATLGRYRLVEQIGEGGMGQVWKARDSNLDRDVAIKVLRSSGDAKSKERFRREALVLSRLSHPGVATIFDFDSLEGNDYLVMEYVPGGTLASRIAQGPLSIDNVLRYGAGIAEALDSAHESGFVHRDLKPGNVVISEHDRPKILDFGIALLIGGDEGVPRITQAGMIVGSVPYMSPEQLFGNADDARTDIYSFGVMMFEMVTGKLPFIKDRPEALMYAIINNAAPSARSLRPDIPPPLDALIGECLRKDPAQRPETAGAVSAELRRLRRSSTDEMQRESPRTAVRSIAVLPFRNVSGDAAQEYFVAGMTEAITSDLSRIKALRVISRTSTTKYRDTVLSLPEVGRELNVDALLEGSALVVGNRVRVNVKLVRARDEETLWADRYDRDVDDVLQLQSDLAETVVKEIAVQLTPTEAKQLGKGQQRINRAAYEEFLRSRHSSYGATRDGIEIGIRHAKRALEIDPNFALGWSSLADSYMLLGVRQAADYGEMTSLATQAAQKAIELDPDLGDGYASLGIMQFFTNSIREAAESLEKAIRLNPNHSVAYNILARTHVAFGRFEKAMELAQTSIGMDPLGILNHTTVADTYYFWRKYDKAVLAYKLAHEVDPRFDGAVLDLGRSYEALGRFEEARAQMVAGVKMSNGAIHAVCGLAHLEIASGNVAEGRKTLQELISSRSSRPISAWSIAALYSSLGELDEAFRWFDTAVAERSSGLTNLKVHPRLDPIRNDPRYQALLEKVGLAD